MTLATAIKKAKGHAGAWRVERERTEDGIEVASLWHYSTKMISWRIDSPLDSAYLDWSLGHGSVSDQQGMNTAFALLGLPYYYSRRGGADILSLNCREDAARLPLHVRRNPDLHLGIDRGACVSGFLGSNGRVR